MTSTFIGWRVAHCKMKGRQVQEFQLHFAIPLGSSACRSHAYVKRAEYYAFHCITHLFYAIQQKPKLRCPSPAFACYTQSFCGKYIKNWTISTAHGCSALIATTLWLAKSTRRSRITSDGFTS